MKSPAFWDECVYIWVTIDIIIHMCLSLELETKTFALKKSKVDSNEQSAWKNLPANEKPLIPLSKSSSAKETWK